MSPLIVIGEVEEVDSPKERGPSKATVRVLEVKKGRCTEKTIRIESGPLRSCDPEGSYYRFDVGQKSIFIEVCIQKAISAHESESTEEVVKYLEAAMASRASEKPKKRTAQEYRAWFRDHPAK